MSPYNVAQGLAAVGRLEEALTWFERGMESRDFLLAWMGVDPLADPFRGDPRFNAGLRRIGVPYDP